MGMGAEAMAEKLEKFVEADTSVIGQAVGKASEASGVGKDRVYLASLALIVLAVGMAAKAEAAAMALVVTVPYPMIRSLRVMEVGPGPEQGVMLLYWSLFALILSIPVPVLRLVLALLLQHPVTNGAELLYHQVARPFLLLQHRDVNLSAFARLHPLIASAIGLDPATLASAKPEAVDAAVKAAAQLLGLEASLAVHTETPPPPKPSPEANILANPAQFHLLQSAALSGIRNAALKA